MSIGDKIRRIRQFRGMTQEELGVAVGFKMESARYRISQYETGSRKPREDLLKEIAKALDVNYRVIYEPKVISLEDVMYTLFYLDDLFSLRVHDIMDLSDPSFPEKRIAVSFGLHSLNSLFKEWLIRYKELEEGIISKDEYREWQLNWPQTSDNCGKTTPSKEWREKRDTEELPDVHTKKREAWGCAMDLGKIDGIEINNEEVKALIDKEMNGEILIDKLHKLMEKKYGMKREK